MKKLRILIILFTACTAINGNNEACMKNENLFFVILAGGSGERLWPLSKQKKPKQLLVVGKQKTLLEQAIDRVKLIAHSNKNIIVSTTKRFEKQVHACVHNLVGDIIVEPGAKDTGPAILYTTLKIQEKHPDALLVFLPADPYIPVEDYPIFADGLTHAIECVEEHDDIALIGVHPTYPATGYGYIEFTDDADERTGLHKVRKFHEKPSRAVADYYMNLNNMLWNIGIFCGKAQTFIQEFATHAPCMYEQVLAHVQGTGSFDDVEKISVDYAIIEKSNKVWVQPAHFSWCDVGNIGVLLSLKKEHNTLSDNSIEINAKNNLIDVPNKLVALIGVDDLCVVQTDNALLITKRTEAEKVRAVVNQLKSSEYSDYL